VTTGLYAGSFDPPHLGHLALIGSAARWCDPLYVVAVGNPRKGDGLFDLAERRELLAASTAPLPGVVPLQHAGLLVRLAADLDVDVLIRGIGKEQATEFEMAYANRIMSGIPTVFLRPDPATRDLSSRTVRAEFRRGGTRAVAGMVPDPVLVALAARRPASV
jgi:pantetheine-phosphate adenylyltransferase